MRASRRLARAQNRFGDDKGASPCTSDRQANDNNIPAAVVITLSFTVADIQTRRSVGTRGGNFQHKRRGGTLDTGEAARGLASSSPPCSESPVAFKGE
jgi:hypothetical protein